MGGKIPLLVVLWPLVIHMEMVLEVLLGGGHVVMEVYKVAEMVTLIKIVWFIDVIDDAIE